MKSWQVITALICFIVGFKSDPFRSKQAFKGPNAGEITLKITKIESYLEVGNKEGAVALLKSLKKADPHNQVIPILEERVQKSRPRLPASEVQRLPASLRDRFYDSMIDARKGRCVEAKAGLKPIERYLKDSKDLSSVIAALCSDGKAH